MDSPEGGHHSGARERIEKLRGRRSTVGGDGRTWEEREKKKSSRLGWRKEEGRWTSVHEGRFAGGRRGRHGDSGVRKRNTASASFSHWTKRAARIRGGCRKIGGGRQGTASVEWRRRERRRPRSVIGWRRRQDCGRRRP
uniref:Uncharacterized protein n=1 Tax=Oryza glumipatula TaxID=40148 RepID=A0A0D9Y9Z9_9ORYZ